MTRWFTWLPLAVVAALGLLFAGYALHHDPHVNPAALVGKPVPAVLLQPLTGGPPQPVRTAGSGPMLINFYASWCAPCVEEAPALVALKAEGTPILGVAYKDATDKSQAFLQTYGNPYAAILADPKGRAAVEFGVSGVPETFAVSASGMIVGKHTGPLTPEAADGLLERLGTAR